MEHIIIVEHRVIEMPRNNDFTTGNLLDYLYHHNFLGK